MRDLGHIAQGSLGPPESTSISWFIRFCTAHACNKQVDTDYIAYVTGGRIICYTLQCSLIDISIPHKSAFTGIYRVTGKNTVAPFSIQQQYSFLRMYCAHQVTLLTQTTVLTENLSVTLS